MVAGKLSLLLVILVLGFAITGSPSAGALDAESGDPALGGQSLEQAASDPTASLMSVQIQNLYSGDYHKLSNENSNTVQLRSAIPFQAFGIDNIARVTLPAVTEGPNGTGVGDMTVFDLAAFNQSWGRWGPGRCCWFRLVQMI